MSAAQSQQHTVSVGRSTLLPHSIICGTGSDSLSLPLHSLSQQICPCYCLHVQQICMYYCLHAQQICPCYCLHVQQICPCYCLHLYCLASLRSIEFRTQSVDCFEQTICVWNVYKLQR